MQVGVVRVVVGIDQQRLPGLGISHFLEILVRELQHLGFRTLVSLAGESDMILGFPDSAVLGCIFLKVLDQFIRGRLAECSECPEIPHFE